MSFERGALRNLFMIPENFGKLIEAKGLNLVSAFLSSLLSAVKKFKLSEVCDQKGRLIFFYLFFHHCLKPRL